MRLALILAAGLVLPPTAAAVAAKGDIEAGHAKSAICGGCHGAQGIAPVAGVPNLAGQTDQYLQWQLVFFRSGRRANAQMSVVAANLTDAEIRNLGAYYASLPRNEKPEETKPDPYLHARGDSIAKQHHCANCHMDDFSGKQAAPAIAHQPEEYLAKALTDYRSAARPSVGVAAMTEAAASLSDQDIAALAHYLGGL